MASDDVVVTFDLFSALIDSRTGAGRMLDRWAVQRGWSADGSVVYAAWDARNKEAQRTCDEWVPYRHLAAGALAETYAVLGLAGDPDRDVDVLLESLAEWPLWPDVEAGLPALATSFRLGLLSNVDDALFRRTRAAPFLDPTFVMTSQRLGVYKPDPRIYLKAQREIGLMVHVATSARDVRGALEAGIPTVRLRRPGHALDPDGPRPRLEASAISDLADLVRAARAHDG